MRWSLLACGSLLSEQQRTYVQDALTPRRLSAATLPLAPTAERTSAEVAQRAQQLLEHSLLGELRTLVRPGCSGPCCRVYKQTLSCAASCHPGPFQRTLANNCSLHVPISPVCFPAALGPPSRRWPAPCPAWTCLLSRSSGSCLAAPPPPPARCGALLCAKHGLQHNTEHNLPHAALRCCGVDCFA